MYSNYSIHCCGQCIDACKHAVGPAMCAAGDVHDDASDSEGNKETEWEPTIDDHRDAFLGTNNMHIAVQPCTAVKCLNLHSHISFMYQLYS